MGTRTIHARHFMQQSKRFRGEPTVVEKVTPFIPIALGFIVACYTLVLFSGKPTDYGMKWVLMPGVLSGLVLVLSGMLCSILLRRRYHKRKQAGIL